MKNKVIFKKWVEYILLTIQCILILILGAECNNFIIFILSKVIALLIIYMNHKLIINFVR